MTGVVAFAAAVVVRDDAVAKAGEEDDMGETPGKGDSEPRIFANCASCSVKGSSSFSLDACLRVVTGNVSAVGHRVICTTGNLFRP